VNDDESQIVKGREREQECVFGRVMGAVWQLHTMIDCCIDDMLSKTVLVKGQSTRAINKKKTQK